MGPGARGLHGVTAAGHVVVVSHLPVATVTAPGQPLVASTAWARDGGTDPATLMTVPLAPRTSEKCSVLNLTVFHSVENSTHGRHIKEGA